MRVDWDDEKDAVVKTYYPEHGPAWDGWERLIPGVSEKAVAMRAGRLGVKCKYRGPKSWTKAQDRVAVALLAQICKSTGRSPYAVIARLRTLYVESKRRAA